MYDPKATAKETGLNYVTDAQLGIRRKKRGRGFIYVDESTGNIIKAKKHLVRIEKLVVPPAWQEVWICKDPKGHLQVTGRDAKDRKQYRYHPDWYIQRNKNNYDRMLEFGSKIPRLRKRIEKDLKLPGHYKEKILAAIVKLMILTQTRVGNTEYAQENDSYGLTTLLNEHAKVKHQKVELKFQGKSDVEHEIVLSDPALAKIIRRCQELPGEELFEYVDESGSSVDINSSDVNDYLRETTGTDFTAKDLRTWGGTAKAVEILVQMGPCQRSKESYWKKRNLSVIKEVASHLRNTVSICRKYYLHPVVANTDRSGILHEKWKRCKSSRYMSREEHLLLTLLKQK